MGSIAGDDAGSGCGKDERILVSVRIRPMSSKETERHDLIDWECINNDTIIFKGTLPDRSLYPGAYTFDRVFGCNSTTKEVYDEGAKEVALSVVKGINSSIFAYGQTSSGKTYTMSGITEYGVSEIYDYIHKHTDREFVLKFSAIEIYNEAVKDLLNPDTGQLRLLDDPEKGTIVEKLTEERLCDKAHLKELLSFCQAQRQIGETTLNEMSSRSHQILRLSVESSARELSGKDNFSTLTATVNFVDLAGSERASQALTAGSRLKEGCHINRSLLTLGTVIRKLSKGRNGHVPYRDSKLTRILQSSLGGNARTAIICTMSPAHTHIEQSRNTLQFASCAKEVTTSARVNVVMSDKALVKHLRKELSRLENELRHMGTSATKGQSNVLRDKDTQIKKMEKEMRELMKQRDLAHSRLGDLLRVVGDDQPLGHREELGHSMMPYAHLSYEDSLSTSSGSSYPTYAHSPAFSECSEYDQQSFGRPELRDAFSTIYHSASAPTIMRQEETSPLESPGFSGSCKDVRSIDSLNKDEDFDLLSTEDIDSLLPHCVGAEDIFKETNDAKNVVKENTDAKEHCTNELGSKRETDLKADLSPLPTAGCLSSSRRPTLVRSRSCRATLMTDASSPSPRFLEVEEYRATPAGDFLKDFPGRREHMSVSAINYGAEQATHLGNGSEDTEKDASSEDPKPQNAETAYDGSSTKISNSIGQVKENANQQEMEHTTGKDSENRITIKDACLNPVLKSLNSTTQRRLEFEKKRQEIVELWHECHVSLVHRSCFFILIKGDPADSIYMEVEYRRLTFLKGSSGLESSLKNIRRERAKICRLLNKLQTAERESLYRKWGIELHSKQRRLQLASRLWSNTKDMDNVRDSAMLVAKLFGFLEPGIVPKEMFGLSFTPQRSSGKSFNWKHPTSLRR